MKRLIVALVFLATLVCLYSMARSEYESASGWEVESKTRFKGTIKPHKDDTYDVGTPALGWKRIYVGVVESNITHVDTQLKVDSDVPVSLDDDQDTTLQYRNVTGDVIMQLDGNTVMIIKP